MSSHGEILLKLLAGEAEPNTTPLEMSSHGKILLKLLAGEAEPNTTPLEKQQLMKWRVFKRQVSA